MCVPPPDNDKEIVPKLKFFRKESLTKVKGENKNC